MKQIQMILETKRESLNKGKLVKRRLYKGRARKEVSSFRKNHLQILQLILFKSPNVFGADRVEFYKELYSQKIHQKIIKIS